MIRWITVALLGGLLSSADLKTPALSDLKEGDIIFQSSQGRQAAAIKLATHSQYSHVGIVLKKDGKLQVLEAVQPVGYQTLEAWTVHGESGKFEVRRLVKADSVLTEARLAKMRKLGDSYAGKNYDLAFRWDDTELYCSELVWKLYSQGAGYEVCPLRRFKDYDFSDARVKAEVEKRFGNKVPTEEKIVAPQDIFISPKVAALK